MTDNSFSIKVHDDVVSFLKNMELFKEDDFNPNSHYADSVKDISRYGTHYDIIQEIWNTYSYDLILNDDSIFQFHKDGDDLRYCFMQNPKVKISWEEYLHKNDWNDNGFTPEELEFCRGCYDNGDDEACYECNDYPIYLRYDVSGSQYKEGIHPYSHLHVGLHNEIRFPISKILTPEMFAQIAVKMTYPVLWKEKIAQNNIWEFQKTVKKGCKDVAKEEWTDIDKYDLFFI